MAKVKFWQVDSYQVNVNSISYFFVTTNQNENRFFVTYQLLDEKFLKEEFKTQEEAEQRYRDAIYWLNL